MKNDFIKSAIKLYNKTAEALYMTPVDFSEISTDNCRMLWLNAGFKPKCSQYGNMLGGFLYVPTGKIYNFRFHIHEPGQKIASLSNRMTSIEEICEEIIDLPSGPFADIKCRPTTFGHKAFWLYTPIDTLGNQEDRDLRQLMQSITAYSRKMQFCQKLRKTDKKYLKYKADEQNKINGGLRR